MKYLPLIIILAITGCAITDVERQERLEYLEKTERDFWTFVNDCQVTGGHLYIDSPVIERRVHNAPINVWEMKDVVCEYDDMPPRRLRD
jgi:hypothetical protein